MRERAEVSASKLRHTRIIPIAKGKLNDGGREREKKGDLSDEKCEESDEWGKDCGKKCFSSLLPPQLPNYDMNKWAEKVALMAHQFHRDCPSRQIVSQVKQFTASTRWEQQGPSEKKWNHFLRRWKKPSDLVPWRVMGSGLISFSSSSHSLSISILSWEVNLLSMHVLHNEREREREQNQFRWRKNFPVC